MITLARNGRLNKHWLYKKLEKTEGQFAFMIIYTGKEDQTYEEIEKAMKTINMRFVKKNIRARSNPNETKPPLS